MAIFGHDLSADYNKRLPAHTNTCIVICNLVIFANTVRLNNGNRRKKTAA